MEMLQSVAITLADGRVLMYTGKAQVDPVKDKDVGIVKVAFTEPLPLPKGMSWDTIQEEKK